MLTITDLDIARGKLTTKLITLEVNADFARQEAAKVRDEKAIWHLARLQKELRDYESFVNQVIAELSDKLINKQ